MTAISFMSFCTAYSFKALARSPVDEKILAHAVFLAFARVFCRSGRGCVCLLVGRAEYGIEQVFGLFHGVRPVPDRLSYAP